MIIQTNPEAFSNRFPVHMVTNIDRSIGVVTLNGSDGSSLDVRLDSWGVVARHAASRRQRGSTFAR